MTRYRFFYDRCKETDNKFCDPTQSLIEASFQDEFSETPYGNDKTYLFYVDSDRTMEDVDEDINNLDGFSFVYTSKENALEWCNSNIDHEEGEEFTLEGDDIIDNRKDDLLI